MARIRTSDRRTASRCLSGSVALLAALALLAAACAPAAPAPAAKPATQQGAQPAAAKPSTVAELVVYKGSDRQQILEEGARKEGGLTWYTSLAGPIITAQVDGFKKKYPGINVEVFRADTGDLVTRVNQEATAGQQGFDAIESPLTTTRLLFGGKLTTPYFSPSVDKLPDEVKTPASGGLVEHATDRISYIGFAYNTGVIPQNAVPKTHQDLLNPALTGKLVLIGSTTGQRWVGSVLKALGDEKGREFLKEFATKQKPTVQEISVEIFAQMIGKGEIQASPVVFYDYINKMKNQDKQPVDFAGTLQPVIANAGQVSVATKAPHPHAAMLFVDYLLGDGQQVYKDNYYFPGNQKMPFESWVPEKGKTTEQIEKDAKLWKEVFDANFRKF